MSEENINQEFKLKNIDEASNKHIITEGIKKYKSIIKKKKKKHDKILLLAKSKLNSVEVLFSKALIDSNISHDEFVLRNNLPKE